jgi:inositol-phosphate phosphatase / L-galactose 1-phosphate phosphatase / histidinol-phosphatase
MLSSTATPLPPAKPLSHPASANPNPCRPLLPVWAAPAAVCTRGRPPIGSVRASAAAVGREEGEMATERLVEVAQRAADAAGEVLRKYFRQRVEIIDKEDLSACSPSFFLLGFRG